MRFVKLNSNRFLLTLFYSQLIGFAGISAGTFYVGSGVFNSHLFLIRLQENSWPSERGLKPVNAEKGNEHATIDWGSYPGQSIVMGRAALKRKQQSDLTNDARLQPAHENFHDDIRPHNYRHLKVKGSHKRLRETSHRFAISPTP
jgi:hypothetical protein